MCSHRLPELDLVLSYTHFISTNMKYGRKRCPDFSVFIFVNLLLTKTGLRNATKPDYLLSRNNCVRSDFSYRRPTLAVTIISGTDR